MCTEKSNWCIIDPINQTKEHQMGFEKKVLEVVAKTIGAETEARFFNGSLFVECTVAEAVKLETKMLKTLNCGIVMCRESKSTTAYDFI